MAPMELQEYLVERTQVGDDTECWEWQLSVGSHGYGQGAWEGEVRTAHSLWWQAVKGERYRGNDAEAITLHHVCHNKRCCNPSHLEAITNRENARMNSSRRQTHCSICGDEYAGRGPNGVPRCKRCNNRRNREWYQRQRA